MNTLMRLENGNVISVKGTEGQISGYCPYCNARVHASTSKRGIRFTVLDRGEVHTDPRCARLEKLIHTPDFEETEDMNSMILKLCRVKNERKGGGNNPMGGGEEIGKKGPGKNGEPEEKLTAIKTLQGLIDAGLNLMPFDKKLKDGKIIGESITIPSWLRPLEEAGIPFDGNKVFEFFPDNYYEEKKLLYGTLKWVYDKKERRRLHLILYFRDEKLFCELIKQLFKPVVTEDGRTRMKPVRNKKVLAAGSFDKMICAPEKCANKKYWGGCEGCLGKFSAPVNVHTQILTIEE